ncbi:hypothetical protein QJS04_geneDACA003018 [Acorus gramineus]|uniref:Uncharacterized protein n=1 Tax=Acorus gramineus TaxID=55184 RepID=A0AAV9BUN1_ACOGR|nr:hypothetical protein QJS04_geneDACA003018 [Acorus gramineus]
MNHVGVSQNGASRSDGDRRGPLCCPKPRRLSVVGNDSIPPLRWQSKPGADLLDLILTKGSYGSDLSSPPFFCGSPPSRAANPVVHDARFGEGKATAAAASPVQSVFPPSPSPRKACASSRSKFGFTPAAVRVEGFDTDHRGRGITAVA